MPTKVLVGTDGSTTAARAVDRAVEVATAAGATLTVMSVGPPDSGRRTVKSAVDRYASASVRIDTKIASGEPSVELVEAAAGGRFRPVGGREPWHDRHRPGAAPRFGAEQGHARDPL